MKLPSTQRLSRLLASPGEVIRLLVAALAVGLLTQVIATPFIAGLNEAALHAAFERRAGSMSWAKQMDAVNAWKDKVVLLSVDEETLQHKGFGSWPLPRRLYGDLLRRLARAKVQAVAFDILFDTPQANQGADNDATFAAALRDCPQGILVNHVSSRRGRTSLVWPTATLLDAIRPEERRSRVGWTYVGEDSIDAVPLLLSGDSTGKPPLSLALLLAARLKGVAPDQVAITPDQQHLQLGPERIPLNPGDASYRINYLWGGSLSDQSLSTSHSTDANALAVDARGIEAQQRINCLPFFAPFEMSDSDLEYYFKDRVVLVGVTAAAGFDVKSTPLGEMAGMDVHANLILDLLSGLHLRSLSLPKQVGLTVASILFVGLIIMASPVFGAIVTLGSCIALYVAVPGWALMRGMVFEPAGLVTALLSSATCVGAWQHYQDKLARQRLADLVKKVAPLTDHLVDDFLRSRSQTLALKGESIRLTIMFSDVRGYTTLSEQVDAQTMFDTLNVLYTETGHIIHANHGAIFEYLGDAQMVLFGLNPEHPDHEDDAMRASLAMVERVRQLNETWAANGQQALHVGVGLCTGTVALGFMGSMQRQQYSVIGDTVNTAARLQGMSAQLGSSIVVSAATQEALGPGWNLTRQSGIRLKGKAQEVTVYLHPEGSASSAANAPSKTGGEHTHG